MTNRPVKASGSRAASAWLLGDIRQMIEETRAAVAATVNAGLTMLYWRIGDRINQEILKGKRADYGAEIISAVSRRLEAEYGNGFSSKNLRHMIRLAEAFPDERIVSTLSRQLSWSHFKEIIYLRQPLQKEFYAEICRVEGWNVRTLRKKIASMLYERTALSKKPVELAKLELETLREEDRLTPDLVFRDPYLLDFLWLKGAYQEKDLEAAILRDLEAFIMELGAGFTFVARQKRIMVDHDDFYLDLLFFHRVLCAYRWGQIRPDFQPIHGKCLFRAFCSRRVNDQFRIAATGTARFVLGRYWLDRRLFPAVKKAEHAEIVATFSAAWNNFLLDGGSPTDTEIIDEVLTSWHESRERFEAPRLQKTLEWRRKKNLVLVGHGKKAESVGKRDVSREAA